MLSQHEIFMLMAFFVAVPPDIVYDDTSGDLAVAEGDNATLWCKATGHPTPRITWRREDGGPIIIRKGTREAIRGTEKTSLRSVQTSH